MGRVWKPKGEPSKKEGLKSASKQNLLEFACDVKQSQALLRKQCLDFYWQS